MNRFFQRAYHFGQRVLRESRRFPEQRRHFGFRVARAAFIDGLIPPGKSERYIHTIEHYVDHAIEPILHEYQQTELKPIPYHREKQEIVPVWCCWWQGEEQMPELVKMCYSRLKEVIPTETAELHLITLENYQGYVQLPEYILDKFNRGIITMTTMSDILRFNLLYKYGGYWIDATVFFTDEIPKAYFTRDFYCQRMHSDPEKVKREACRGNWCGFSMAGTKKNIVFRYMRDAFNFWWENYDDIPDYVLIDYLLWSGYRKIPEIRRVIDTVEDNNEDIFEMYQVLNQEYSDQLYNRLREKNVMHKLTYKMDLIKTTSKGKQTLYGYLCDHS